MAHGTLIDGTAYEIGGGTTLVDGTSYKINNGKVLVGGTEYTITFSLPSGMSSNIGLIDVNCIAYGDGYWVIGGQYKYSSSRKDAYIAYTTDLTKSWTIARVWAGSTSAVVSSLVYANGYWVAVGWSTGSSGSSANKSMMAYATSPNGTWTSRTISSSTASYGRRAYCVIHDGTYFVISGIEEYDDDDDEGWRRNRLYYLTAPNGTWSITDVGEVADFSSVGADTPINVAYGNGYYVVSTHRKESSTLYSYIIYGTSLTGNWSIKELWSYSTGSSNYTSCVECKFINGYFVMCGCKGGVSGTRSAMLAYGTTPSEIRTKTVYSGTSGQSSSSHSINDIAYSNGKWVICGRTYDSSVAASVSCIGYCSTVNGTYTILNCKASHSITAITDIGGQLVATTVADNSGDNTVNVGFANSPDELINILKNGG